MSASVKLVDKVEGVEKFHAWNIGLASFLKRMT
jgi:hypothetical protein